MKSNLRFMVYGTLLVTTFLCQADDRTPTEDQKKDTSSVSDLFYKAVYKGDLDEVKRLSVKLDADTVASFRISLQYCPSVEVISYLRDIGLIRLSDLQIAAIRGNTKEIQQILNRIREEGGEAAVKKTLLGITYFLGDSSDSPLRLAIRRGNVGATRVLLSAGADANEQLIRFGVRRDQRTAFQDEYPLTEAVAFGNPKIVKLLIDAGALLEEPATRYVDKKDSGVYLSEFYIQNAHLPKKTRDKKLEEMFEAGLLMKEIDPFANSICPLAVAIQRGRAKNVSVLLKAGANPNVVVGDHNGFRPLHLAVVKGNPEIVRLLIKYGADVNALTSDGRTALSYAVGYKHGDIADLLRAAGAK
jgi:ankyrin repeat protein